MCIMNKVEDVRHQSAGVKEKSCLPWQYAKVEQEQSHEFACVCSYQLALTASISLTKFCERHIPNICEKRERKMKYK